MRETAGDRRSPRNCGGPANRRGYLGDVDAHIGQGDGNRAGIGLDEHVEALAIEMVSLVTPARIPSRSVS